MFWVLAPQGAVAAQESALIIHATLLMLIVVVPVFFLLFFFAWRYRAGNPKALYQPNWEHSRLDELVWWAVPLEIVLVLAALTWSSTHELDPYKPLVSQTPAISVEVVALPWKWLFIYPELGIATVNYLKIPAGVPVDFSITADAPMNSFWIPQLGGQIYAMTGMVTPLHLIAEKPGTYLGLSANYSGIGFAAMNFEVSALPQAEFEAWAAAGSAASTTLDKSIYDALATPGTMGTTSYASVEAGLFDAILNTFNAGAPMHGGMH